MEIQAPVSRPSSPAADAASASKSTVPLSGGEPTQTASVLFADEQPVPAPESQPQPQPPFDRSILFEPAAVAIPVTTASEPGFFTPATIPPPPTDALARLRQPRAKRLEWTVDSDGRNIVRLDQINDLVDRFYAADTVEARTAVANENHSLLLRQLSGSMFVGHTYALEDVLVLPGIDLNAAPPGGDAAIQIACANNNFFAVEALLARPSLVLPLDQGDLITLASHSGGCNVTSLLLRHPRIDIVSRAADILQTLTVSGDEESAYYLLSVIDVQRDIDGVSALRDALVNRRGRIVEVLVTKGVDITDVLPSLNDAAARSTTRLGCLSGLLYADDIDLFVFLCTVGKLPITDFLHQQAEELNARDIARFCADELFSQSARQRISSNGASGTANASAATGATSGSSLLPVPPPVATLRRSVSVPVGSASHFPLRRRSGPRDHVEVSNVDAAALPLPRFLLGPQLDTINETDDVVELTGAEATAALARAPNRRTHGLVSGRRQHAPRALHRSLSAVAVGTGPSAEQRQAERDERLEVVNTHTAF